MVLTLELTPEAEARLQSEARQQGFAMPDYVRQMVETNLSGHHPLPPREEEDFPIGDGLPSEAELESLFAELTEGMEGVPPLPADFSRADLYGGHD